MSRTRRSVMLLSALLLSSVRVEAQQSPNKDNGFSPGKAYHIGEIDSVNAFNGNLILRIPIGGSYPVGGGGLGYGLTLVYNSNLWELDVLEGSQTLQWAVPNRIFNAGLGWRLSLGQLVPVSHPSNKSKRTWLYVAPDGSQHEFWNRLHPDGSEPVAPGIFYTRDGTYLRLNEAARSVEFPDGQIHHFDHKGRLISIRDRFNNFVGVSTSGNPWIITDSHGRAHRIHFSQLYNFYHNHPENPDHPGVVTEVELASFDGDTATYTFGYQQLTVVRGCPSDDPVQHPHSFPIPLLTSIGLPDGSSYSIAPSHYDPGAGPGCDNQSGVLRKLTLPTRGRLEWDYNLRDFPTSSQSDCLDYTSQSVAVSKRRLRNADGNVAGEWNYDFELELAYCAPGPQQDPIRWAKATVTNPSGHRTVQYFSAVRQGVIVSGWPQEEYGLPLTRCDPERMDCPAVGPPYLSTRTYDAEDLLVRSTYVTYDWDAGTAGGRDAQQVNQRLSRTRTTYGPGEGRFKETLYSVFDGFGNYRTTRLDGNFGAGDVRSETVSYNDMVTGAWPVGSPWILNTFKDRVVSEGGSTARQELCFEAGTGFLLRTRALRSGTSPDDHDVITRYARNAAGEVTSELSYGGDLDTVSPHGTLCTMGLPAESYRTDHSYEYGTLKTSRYSGPGGAPLAFLSVNRVIDRNTGLVAASHDAAGLRTDFIYDRMGRPTVVRPAAGHDGRTSYTYSPANPSKGAMVRVIRRPNRGPGVLALEDLEFDDFGRLWKERRLMPDGTMAARKRFYHPEGWPVSVSEWGSNASTRYHDMDPLGRPKTIKPPDGSPANPVHDIELTYFGENDVVRRVHVGTGRDPVTGTIEQTEHATQQIFDRQGRLWKVIEPSGAGGTNVTTIYEYDIGGRLDKVRTVSPVPPPGVGLLTQTRLFHYDNRGFLLWERHPEIGPSGNGYVVYCDYDARGHARRRIEGNSVAHCGAVTAGARDIRLTLDRAERLTRVAEGGAGGRVLQSFEFADDNGAGEWGKGKLRVAERYNYVSISGTPYTDLVRETYTYGGRGGRVSGRLTENLINGYPAGAFDQGWVYDELGNVESLVYPNSTCTTCSNWVPRTVGYDYTNGSLTSVGGFTGAAGITYHANGLVHQVHHANGVTWTQASDPTGMARPAAYAVSGARNPGGAPANWQTDAYGYDGAGNVTRIGPSWYLYDRVSRLTSAGVYPGLRGEGPEQRQSYAYGLHATDASAAFGNIQAITTQIGAGTPLTRNIPTSSATNRLTGSAAYDNAGSLVSWNGQSYDYDRLGQTWRVSTGGGQQWVHLYAADGERLWSYQTAGGEINRWTLRDLDGKVLREYTYDRPTDTWTVERDYIYRGATLLAAVTPSGVRHFHPDHLGTPRLITDAGAIKVAFHAYLPFGEEATVPTQDTERLKFTGHERDLHAQSGANPAADDLDYMHARYYSALVARFLSVDPTQLSAVPEVPQTWNRYVYARNNPVVRLDPDGLIDVRSAEDKAITEDADVLVTSLRLTRSTSTGYEYGALIGTDGAGDFLTSPIYTNNHPGQVSHFSAISRSGSDVLIKGTQYEVVRTMHTHLKEGRRYPVPGTSKDFVPKDTTKASQGDQAHARGTGVAGFIIVPDKGVLVRVNNDGTAQVVLSGKDFNQWLKRAKREERKRPTR